MAKVLIHDISYHQGDLSRYWQLFKDKGCKVIIIQSSNGLAYQNYYKETIKIAKDLGFLVGSYHYYRQHIPNTEGSWVTCSPTRQAENYFNWTQKAGVKLDFPPVLDVENGGNPQGCSYSGVTACLTHIEKLFGRIPMIYSSPSILGGLAKTGWERYPLWLAHYTTENKITIPKPWTKWTMWQYTDKETYTPTGSTLKKPIDHNWFNGSDSDLNKFIIATGGTASSTTGTTTTTTTPTSTTPSSTVAASKPTQAELADLKNRITKAIDDWYSTL